MAQKTNNAKPKAQQPRMVKWLWIIAMFPFALLFFLLLLTAIGLFGKLPSFEELENPKSNIATEIYSEDGKVIGSFFVQNRSYVEYADLFPEDSSLMLRLNGDSVPAVVAALVSTEDERFYSHSGIDIKALIRVGVKTIALGNSGQGGGSTITQQVAKNLFPRDTTSRGPVMRKASLVISKLKEWITAVKLEYNYTKEELIAMYLNTVEYGSNAYGIKSAARTFFNKTPDQLNIQEAAVLVGVVNKPTRYNPVLNYDHSIARRNTVMSRMRANGCITRAQYDSLSALPIQLNYRPISHNDGTATYFREMLRLVMNQPRPKRSQFNNDWDFDQALDQWNNNPLYGWCQKNQKADGTNYNIYRDGLKIYTTINSSMQKYAEEALLEHMTSDVQPRMDRQVKNTGVLFRNQSKEDIERILRNAMRYSDRYYQMNKAGVSEEEIYASFDRPCRMKIFTYKGDR
ncbi:MAG: transglycosylase domain-containing protein, partial [Rikenellaceae bacterium]|nr:transglycosylase domain-containing protein [Rikenellaceae bacterium]